MAILTIFFSLFLILAVIVSIFLKDANNQLNKKLETMEELVSSLEDEIHELHLQLMDMDSQLNTSTEGQLKALSKLSATMDELAATKQHLINSQTKLSAALSRVLELELFRNNILKNQVRELMEQ